MTDRSRLVLGTVTHRRYRPTRRAFRYRVWHLLLDVDDLDRVAARVRGFRVGRRGPVGIRRQDHFGPADLPLRDKVTAWVEARGATMPAGPLLLWAYPRVLGHVFNPVAWWFAHDPDGTLGLVVAEVRNTFGDWHAYLLDDLEVDGRVVRARTDKAFHVSPFLPIAGLDYRFAFRVPAPDDGTGHVAVNMQVADTSGVVLDATQAGRLQPLTTAALWRAMVTRPLVTLWTVVGIHTQALRLWWRRTPFHRRPEPPPTGLDAVVGADHGAPAAEPPVPLAPSQEPRS